jgi:hypothetical protein
MSCILYYSKYCNICNKYLQILSKINKNDIHFICIDKRLKEQNKTYIILENGQKIILPDSVTRVPALLLLTKGYQIIFGEQILEYLKPQQESQMKQATQNNMEPMAFSLGGGSIVSDHYSFLDQAPEDLEAKGNGGMRQMHNYVDLNTAFSGQMYQNTSPDDFNTTIRGSKKMGEDDSNQEMENRIQRMKEERDSDIKKITGNRPPMI